MIKNLHLKKIRTLLIVLSALFYSGVLSAFPGGNYTINPAAAASASNYLSFTAFANDLKNTARGDGGPDQYAVGGAGLQGPVVVEVSPGTYAERFLLTAIVGSSATNRVTINGNGAIVEFTPTSTADCGVISLNGTDFFTFNNLEVRMNQTTYGYCFRLHNAADNNVIKNCKLRCNNITTAPNTGSAYIWLSNGTTSVGTSGNCGNNNLIDSCDMRSGAGTNHGPYYGFATYGFTTTPDTMNAGSKNTISNCNIRDFHYYGIYMAYNYSGQTINNTIHNSGRTSAFGIKYGIYQYYGTGICHNNRIFNLNGNTPQSSSLYGIYFYNAATTASYDNWTYESKVTNNYVYLFGTAILYNYTYFNTSTSRPSQTLDVEHNTFILDYPTPVTNTSTNYTLYASNTRRLTNNILYHNIGGTGGTGTKYVLYNVNENIPGTDYWASKQNNTLAFGPNAGGTALNIAFGVNSATGTTASAISQFSDLVAAGLPASNLNVNPQIVSNDPANLDLRPTSPLMANKGLYIPALPYDNSGASRSNPPDIGAFEYYVDLAITNITTTFPIPSCSGFDVDISGTIKNNSAFPVTNPSVSYNINNGTNVDYIVSTTIAPNDTFDFTIASNVIFSQTGLSTVRLFNTFPDDLPSNDTFAKSVTVSPAPGGSIITHNTTESSIHSQFSGSSINDLTYRDEKLVYDLSEPSRLGYTNADYDVKWRAFVTAKTLNGTNANAIVSSNNAAPFMATINPTAMWEDSTIEVSIRVLSIQTNCDTVFTRRVFVAPKPNINISLPSLLCERTDIYFENLTTIKSGSMEYEWDFGDGSPTTDNASPVQTYSSFGSYTVTLNVTTKPYNFVAQHIFNVDITEMPIARINNINNCEGQNIVLNNGTSYAGGGTTVYEWSFNDNSPEIITTSRTAVNKMFSTAGAYTVTLTATADGCSDVVSKIVYQFAKPIAAFSKANGDCLNDAYLFNNQSTISDGLFGNAWFWDDNSNIATDMHPTYKFTSAGIKNVKLRVNSEFGCKDSAFLQVNVKQTPTTDFVVPFACDRTPTPFTNLTNLNGETLNKYTWDLGQGTPNNATAPVVSWSNLGPRTIKLTTLLTNGCSTSASKEINVGVQPLVSFDVENQCAGSEMAFTNLTTYPNGQISYQWNFGDGNSTATAAPTHTYTNGQTYSVKLIGTILNGCADSMTKNVNVGKLPSTCDFDIERDWTVSSKNFKFTPTGGALTGTQYTWVTGDGNKLNSTAAGANYTYNANLQYCVTMVASSTDGCECSKTKCIDVSTDINNINALNFSIYPNPSNGVFNVKTTSNSHQMTVLVYNVIGEIVKTFEFQNNEGIMNLSHLNNGVYIVKVITDNQSSTQKINIIK
jgi:PKD repeat protein